MWTLDMTFLGRTTHTQIERCSTFKKTRHTWEGLNEQWLKCHIKEATEHLKINLLKAIS